MKKLLAFALLFAVTTSFVGCGGAEVKKEAAPKKEEPAKVEEKKEEEVKADEAKPAEPKADEAAPAPTEEKK